MPDPHPFRRAAEAKDIDLLRETLAEDVTFHSPVVFKTYEGREMVMVILSNVVEIFEDFRYLDEARGTARSSSASPPGSTTSTTSRGSTTSLSTPTAGSRTSPSSCVPSAPWSPSTS